MTLVEGLVLLLLGAALLWVVLRLRPGRSTAVDFYLAGQGIGVLTNAWAICGDYFSAASFLGVAAAVYASGLDGAWYATGFAAGFVPVLLFVAAPLRRFGEFSIPDFLGRRLGSERVRLGAAAVVLVIIQVYLVPQAVASGLTWEVLVGWALPGLTASSTGVVVVTVCIAGMVTVGGMRGTTWTQAVQFVVLMAAALWLLALAVGEGFSYPAALQDLSAEPLRAVAGSGPDAVTVAVPNVADPSAPARFNEPGARYDALGQLALVSTLVLGTAGLPHILNRFFTSPTGRAARRTAAWVLGFAGVFYTVAVALGVAARWLVSAAAADLPWLAEATTDGVLQVPEQAMLALGRVLAGQVGLGVVSVAALVAITSTIAGLLLASAASLGHDVYLRHVRPDATPAQAVRAGRVGVLATAVVSAGLALVLGTDTLADRFPSVVAQMVTWAFAVAGSALTPCVVLAIWWRGMTAPAALAGMAVGGSASLALIGIGLATDAPSSGAAALLSTPTLISGTLATVVAVLVARGTEPPQGLDGMWVRMHGTAADRRAERLARLTVEGL